MTALYDKSEVTVMLMDKQISWAVPKSNLIRIVRSPHLADLKTMRKVFVLTSSENLLDDAQSQAIQQINHAKHLSGVLIRSDLSPVSGSLSTFEMHRLAHIANLNKVAHYSRPIVVRRILEAHLSRSSGQLIADAAVISGRLIVLACNLETLCIPFSSSPLSSILPDERSDFEIDDDGFSILWPKSKIQLDLHGLRRILDPALQAAAASEAHRHDREYGSVVRFFRLKSNLRQQDIGGLSERQISRIESGQQSVTAAAIGHLAKAHGLSENEYMKRIAELMQAPDSDGNQRHRVRRPHDSRTTVHSLS